MVSDDGVVTAVVGDTPAARSHRQSLVEEPGLTGVEFMRRVTKNGMVEPVAVRGFPPVLFDPRPNLGEPTGIVDRTGDALGIGDGVRVLVAGGRSYGVIAAADHDKGTVRVEDRFESRWLNPADLMRGDC